MKIYDCITYFNEPELFEIRANILNKYVDKFIVIEAQHTHSGKPKKINFNINQFKKFEEKIIHYIIHDQPKNLDTIYDNDKINIKRGKQRFNSLKRIEQSYNEALKCIKDFEENDIFILSDADEIPNLEKINFADNKIDFFIFKQKMFYYKFDLYYDLIPWFGSKACKFKKLKKPSNLRNLKSKKYPLWRVDTWFSEIRQNKVQIIENGGWHFSNIKKPDEIEKKLFNFGHHNEIEESGIDLNFIKKMVKEQKVYYNHFADKRENKELTEGYKLKMIDYTHLPDYLISNKDKYKEWFS